VTSAGGAVVPGVETGACVALAGDLAGFGVLAGIELCAKARTESSENPAIVLQTLRKWTKTLTRRLNPHSILKFLRSLY
jgi:hypothetical protein